MGGGSSGEDGLEGGRVMVLRSIYTLGLGA
jgi:hypothetical protein